MDLTRIMSRKRKKEESEVRKLQQVKISEQEVQKILDWICENINFEVLCSESDIHNMEEKVLVIESVTVTSFEEPPVVNKKEEKKPSLWRRIMNRLLKR